MSARPWHFWRVCSVTVPVSFSPPPRFLVTYLWLAMSECCGNIVSCFFGLSLCLARRHFLHDTWSACRFCATLTTPVLYGYFNESLQHKTSRKPVRLKLSSSCGRTDMTKPTVTFRNCFASAAKKETVSSSTSIRNDRASKSQRQIYD